MRKKDSGEIKKKETHPDVRKLLNGLDMDRGLCEWSVILGLNACCQVFRDAVVSVKDYKPYKAHTPDLWPPALL